MKKQTDEFRERVETEVFVSTEAADYLGMSRQNLSQQTKAGRIPCIRGKLFLGLIWTSTTQRLVAARREKAGDKKRGGRENPPIPDL